MPATTLAADAPTSSWYSELMWLRDPQAIELEMPPSSRRPERRGFRFAVMAALVRHERYPLAEAEDLVGAWDRYVRYAYASGKSPESTAEHLARFERYQQPPWARDPQRRGPVTVGVRRNVPREDVDEVIAQDLRKRASDLMDEDPEHARILLEEAEALASRDAKREVRWRVNFEDIPDVPDDPDPFTQRVRPVHSVLVNAETGEDAAAKARHRANRPIRIVSVINTERGGFYGYGRDVDSRHELRDPQRIGPKPKAKPKRAKGARSLAGRRTSRNTPSRGAPAGEFYTEYDNDSAAWCVFHTDDIHGRPSGFAFGCYSSREEAEADVERRNQQRSPRNVQTRRRSRSRRPPPPEPIRGVGLNRLAPAGQLRVSARGNVFRVCGPGTEIVTLIFPPTFSLNDVREWIGRSRGRFILDFETIEFPRTTGTIRVPQRATEDFAKGSFYTIMLSAKDDIRAVIGCPLEGREGDVTKGGSPPGSRRQRRPRGA